jgi:hypothetical protein
MSSTEQLLETRKAQMADKLAEEIVEAWLRYVTTLGEEQQAQVRSLDGVALNQQLRKVYADAKKAQNAPAVGGWKLDVPSKAAETEVLKARADATKADNLAAFLAELETKDWARRRAAAGTCTERRRSGHPRDGARPTPGLSEVPPKTIAATLGGSVTVAGSLKQGWSLRSSSGSISGLVAFRVQ